MKKETLYRLIEEALEEETKKDACYHKVKSRYDVWPSAYASGALVKCRKVGAANWGKSKKESLDEEVTDEEEDELKDIKGELNKASKMHKGQADRISDIVKEEKKNCGCGQDPCKTYGIQEKKQSSEDAGRLDKWFGRKGEKGSKGGWVDCKAPDGDGGYKECAQGNRKEKPYCRPTPSACKDERQKREALTYEGDASILEHFKGATLEEGDLVCEGCLFEMLQEASCGCPDLVGEAEYQGRKVTLNKPTRGDVKKFKVYVKDPKTGNVKKVNFGHGGTSAKAKGEKTMKIRKNNPKARKSFRARHNCDNPGPKTKARYWSCKKW